MLRVLDPLEVLELLLGVSVVHLVSGEGLLEHKVIGFKYTKHIKQPSNIWHSSGMYLEGSVLIWPLLPDLLVDVLDQLCSGWWLGTWLGLQLTVLGQYTSPLHIDIMSFLVNLIKTVSVKV